MEPNDKFKLIIHTPVSVLSPDEITRSMTGMPIDELVKDMHANVGGKYDEILGNKNAPGGAATPTRGRPKKTPLV